MSLRRLRLVPLLLCSLALAACGGGDSDFVECRDDQSCDRFTGGKCLVNDATGHKFCAYPDANCESGMRWSDLDVEESIGGECVADDASDAGVDAMPDAGVPEADFARKYGGSGSDSLNAFGLTSDGFVIGGYFRGTADFGGGSIASEQNGDMIIARYTSSGAFAWATKLGDPNASAWDRVQAIAVAPNDDVVFCGVWAGTIDFGSGAVESTNSFSGDVAIVKLAAANGQPVWARTLRSSGLKQCNGVTIDAEGNVIAVGVIPDSVDFGGGNVTGTTNRGYIAKYNGSNGAYISAQVIASTQPNAVVAAGNGDIIVGGAFDATVNFGGGNRTPAGWDGFVLRLASDGAYVWDAVIPSGGHDQVTALALDAGGDVYAGGYFTGTITNTPANLVTKGGNDGFVARLTGSSGVRQWITGMGGASTDQVSSIAVSTAGHPVVAGYFYDMADFGNGEVTSGGYEDIFIATYTNTTGAFADARRIGGGRKDAATVVSPGRDMNLYVGGQFLGSVDFGSAVLTSNGWSGTDGQPDMFIMRYKP